MNFWLEYNELGSWMEFRFLSAYRDVCWKAHCLNNLFSGCFVWSLHFQPDRLQIDWFFSTGFTNFYQSIDQWEINPASCWVIHYNTSNKKIWFANFGARWLRSSQIHSIIDGFVIWGESRWEEMSLVWLALTMLEIFVKSLVQIE